MSRLQTMTYFLNIVFLTGSCICRNLAFQNNGMKHDLILLSSSEIQTEVQRKDQTNYGILIKIFDNKNDTLRATD